MQGCPSAGCEEVWTARVCVLHNLICVCVRKTLAIYGRGSCDGGAPYVSHSLLDTLIRVIRAALVTTISV